MEPQVFLDTTYSYRRWPYLFVALGFGGFDLFVLVLNASHLTDFEYVAERCPGAIVGLLWLLSTLLLAGWSGWQFFSGATVRTRIDARGITIGTRHIAWTSIETLYGRSAGRGKISLLFTQRGRGPLRQEYVLPIKPLGEDEYEELCSRLRESLGQRHPRLGIG